MSTLPGTVQFIHDDAGYLRWLAGHPAGFVVNSHRLPVPEYLILHRASCPTINTGQPNNWTTTGYMKTCADAVPPLAAWAWSAASGRLRPCGACRPPLPEGATPPRPAEPDFPPTPPSPRPEGPTIAAGVRSVPATIATGCPELDRAWEAYVTTILHSSPIPIPDTDDDLTWHAFLGHSIDMQGFRAAEFAGVDPLTRHAPGFVPLKARGIGVPELASLWGIPAIRNHLHGGARDVPLSKATLNVLRAHGGAVGAALAEAFEHFPWSKFLWSARALLQNSDALRPVGFTFRGWLRRECGRLGVTEFPPADFRRSIPVGAESRTIEQALRERLAAEFYMVGTAMSAYLICDWQLWLWMHDKTAVFATFKLDRYHEKFVAKFGRGLIPAHEAGFARWWLGLYPDLPPRLANECIWLAVENKMVSLN